MENFDEKEMSDFISNQIDEYAKNHTPLVFFAVENKQLGSILEEENHIKYLHSICLKQYLGKKFFNKLKDKTQISFTAYMHKFGNENNEKIKSLSRSLATETLSLTGNE